MTVLLRNDINDWTNELLGLPALNKGTELKVERLEGDNHKYIGIVKVKGVTYRFGLDRKEFEVIN